MVANYTVLIFAAIAVIVIAKLLAWPVKKIIKLATVKFLKIYMMTYNWTIIYVFYFIHTF